MSRQTGMVGEREVFMNITYENNGGISEDLKSRNQMEWVRRMNSIRNRVDEIVMTEIVYKI